MSRSGRYRYLNSISSVEFDVPEVQSMSKPLVVAETVFFVHASL